MISNIWRKIRYEGAGGEFGTQRLLAAARAPSSRKILHGCKKAVIKTALFIKKIIRQSR